jgi:hypothetical protein
MLAAVLCIGYNTSANVAALEGARRHLTFAGFVALTTGGAVAGLIIGAVASALAASSRAAREIDRS